MQSKLQHRRIRAQQNIECFIVLRHGHTGRQGRDRHRHQPGRRRRHRARTAARGSDGHRLLALEAGRAARHRGRAGWASDPRRWSATKAITAPSTRSSPRSPTRYGRIDILVNNAGGTVPTPHVEDVPALVSKHPGRAAQRRRLRAHRAVPRVRGADEPDQPAVVRHPGVPADERRRTAPVRSSTSPAARATRRARRRWSPTAPRSPASTT